MTAQAYDLCLATDVATDLGVTADARVQRAVSAASRAIAGWCDRTFEKGSGLVEYPGSIGRAFLQVKRPPIASITSITECGATVASSDYESTGANVDAGLVLHKFRGWARTDRYDYYSVSQTRAHNEGQSDLIVVTYDGGWVTPGQNSIDPVTYPTVTLPEDIQEAAIQTTVAFLKLRGIDSNVQLEMIGDWKIQYFQRTGEIIPPAAQALLSQYKLGWAV